MEEQPITIINPTCTDARVINDLSKAYRFLNFVPFQRDISAYFLNIYRGLKTLRLGTQFLTDAECFSIYSLFQKFLQNSPNFKSRLNVDFRAIDVRYPGYVYQLTTFSVFAPYHYLTIVIGPENKSVDIYQSFGSTMPIYRVTLNIKEFEKCIEILKKIKKNGKNFLVDINDMLYVETKLYGINLQDYFKILFEHKENPDNIDPDEEEIDSATTIINKILEEYPQLENTLKIYDRTDGFSPATIVDLIDELKHNYMRSLTILVLDEYIPTYMTAGKRNRKTKKSNSKKYKRKTRKIKRM
jgi:hypothetical protein